jgi:hypothetical protein
MPSRRTKSSSASLTRSRPLWDWCDEIQDPHCDINQTHLELAIGLIQAKNCKNKLVPENVGGTSDEEDVVIDCDGGEGARIAKDTNGKRTRTYGKKKSGSSKRTKKMPSDACTQTYCRENLLCLNHLGAQRVSLSSYLSINRACRLSRLTKHFNLNVSG